jgi:hypothetical protein
MEEKLCPFCNRLTITEVCCHCGNRVSEGDTLSYAYRMMMCGVRLDNPELIQEYAREYLNENPKNDVVKYYLFYAQEDPNRYDLILDTTPSLLHEVAIHIIHHTKAKKVGALERFLMRQKMDEEPYLKIIHTLFREDSYSYSERVKDEELFSSLAIPMVFSDEVRPIVYRRNAMIFGILAGVLFILTFLIGLFSFGLEVRYFGFVFIFIIPSYLLAVSTSFLLYKKVKFPFILIVGFIILLLTTYVVLLPESANFAKHCLRILTSGYDFIMYIQEGFII